MVLIEQPLALPRSDNHVWGFRVSNWCSFRAVTRWGYTVIVGSWQGRLRPCHGELKPGQGGLPISSLLLTYLEVYTNREYTCGTVNILKSAL